MPILKADGYTGSGRTLRRAVEVLSMEPQPGCSPFAILILTVLFGVVGFLVFTPAVTEVTGPDPVVIEVPAPTPTP
jgi:hypothetical protein